MSLSADDIIHRIMERAIDTASGSQETALKRYHVSQTADQLPDFRVRNAFYRAELERQINEKREAERKRKEREASAEDRLLRKIETDREKIRREYLEEIEKRKILHEEATRRQLLMAKKYEEIQEAEERKKEEEEVRRKQQLIIEKRIAELKEAVEKRKIEEVERRRQRVLYEKLYGTQLLDDEGKPRLLYGDLALRYPSYVDKDVALRYSSYDKDAPVIYPPFEKRPWNSREYVHSAIQPENLVLEDVYFEAPLPILADVYKKLDSEKRRIKEIMRQRIIQGNDGPN